MQGAGSGALEACLTGFLADPPRSLSTLEYWVGWLDVDFSSPEGGG
jgi:hypothetical protein